MKLDREALWKTLNPKWHVPLLSVWMSRAMFEDLLDDIERQRGEPKRLTHEDVSLILSSSPLPQSGSWSGEDQHAWAIEVMNKIASDLYRSAPSESSATGQTTASSCHAVRSLDAARSAEPQERETPRLMSDADIGMQTALEMAEHSKGRADNEGFLARQLIASQQALSQAREQIALVATAGSASEERAERAEQQIADLEHDNGRLVKTTSELATDLGRVEQQLAEYKNRSEELGWMLANAQADLYAKSGLIEEMATQISALERALAAQRKD